MKKFIIIFLVIFAVLIGFLFFVNTKYFFNKYIATNIKEYGFSYKSVDSALFEGFKIEKLKYKNRLLSNKVELKFDPIKLLQKIISIKKLRLIEVDKNVLENLIDDFKPKEDTSNSIPITLDFEIKDLRLTFKKFKFNDILINSNELKVNYIKLINNKFNIGNVNYHTDTSIGSIDFNGKYEKQVLNINSIDLKKINIKSFLKLLDNIIIDREDRNVSSNLNKIDDTTENQFFPKFIKLDKANITLSPFKFESMVSKKLNIKLSSVKFNLKKIKLDKAILAIKYKSNIVNIEATLKLDNQNISAKKLYIDILKPNKLENIIKKISSTKESNTSSIPMIVDINKLKIKNFTLKVKNYKYKNENIKSVKILSNIIIFDINKSKLQLNNFNVDINSILAKIKINGGINDKISIDKFYVNCDDIDKIIKLLDSNIFNKSKNSNYFKINFIPNKFTIKEAKIDGRKISYEPFIINKASIDAKNISGKIDNFFIYRAKVNVSANSNWGNAFLNGDIKRNKYIAKGEYRADQLLLDEYSIPLIAKNIKPLKVNGVFTLKDLDINIDLMGKDILQNIKDIDILSSKSRLSYNYLNSNLLWDIDALANSTYTGRAKIKNRLIYNNKLSYFGKLISLKNLSFSKELSTLFDNLELDYKGDIYKIGLSFKTDKLKGLFKSKDYNKGILTITNSKGIKLSSLVNLNKKYNNAVVNKLKIDTPINFNKLLPLKGDLKIVSNLVDIIGKWEYKDNFKIKSVVTLPKDSLLLKDLNGLNSSSLFLINMKLNSQTNNLKVKLKNKILSGDINYLLNSKKLDAILKSNSLKIVASGSIDKIKLNINSKSIKKSIKDINKIYKFKNIPNITGSLNAKVEIDNLSRYKMLLKSPKIVFTENKNSMKIKNIYLYANADKDGNININNYLFKVKDYKFFSNKTSKFYIKNGNLKISELWINNSLQVNGNYNIKNSKGTLNLHSSSTNIENKDIKLNIAVNSKIEINKNKISATGKLNIIDGVIKKDIQQKNISSNEDIIIIQRQAPKKSTNFTKNIKLDLIVKSSKGLLYAHNGSHFNAVPDVKIKKEFGSLFKLYGKVIIKKDGYYMLNGKKLILKKGILTFSGSNSNPNINILMKYHDKEYDININLSGYIDRPTIYFTSNPPLTKDQILAYLLFDNSTVTGTHSQKSMVNLMGGTLVKFFLSSIGIKLDRIAIKENGFSIGKSLDKNIAIYYNREDSKSSFEARINIIKSIKTGIIFKEEQQSLEIIFDKEY